MKISVLHTLFYEKLAPLYEKREIDAIFFIYIENKFDIKKHHYFLNPELEGRMENSERRKDLEELSRGCPIQYVTGKTFFYGLEINVNPSVLIPRPETEELVEMILKNEEKRRQGAGQFLLLSEEKVAGGGVPSPDGRGEVILDLATGTGAIAIALAKNIQNATVWATDISKEALETAKKNAIYSNVEITFLHHDLLKDDISALPNHVDIIVSNPPYIPQSERANLHKNVVDYEPDTALFVPDSHPLIFYSAIANIAKKILRKGGTLYFEIYQKFHSKLSAMLAEAGFKEIELWNDISGKPRFVRCKKL